jgi:hypothetical protein
LAFNGLTEVPENPSHWLYCGSTLPGMKIAFLGDAVGFHAAPDQVDA